MGPAQATHYQRMRQEYVRYLSTYKQLAGGSLLGAVTFGQFYVYSTFTNKYSDPRVLAASAYR